MKQGEVTIFIHVNKCIILSFLLAGVEGRGTGPGEAGERRWGRGGRLLQWSNCLIRVALATGNSPGQDISPHVNVTCT